jgi:hypothetical protein
VESVHARTAYDWELDILEATNAGHRQALHLRQVDLL